MEARWAKKGESPGGTLSEDAGLEVAGLLPLTLIDEQAFTLVFLYARRMGVGPFMNK